MPFQDSLIGAFPESSGVARCQLVKEGERAQENINAQTYPACFGRNTFPHTQ